MSQNMVGAVSQTVQAAQSAAASGAVQESVQETVQEASTLGLMTEVPVPVWGIAALVLAVILAAAAVFVLLQRQRAPQTHAVEQLSPKVGKLHGQGSRDGQQDSFSVSPLEMVSTHGLFAVVADGMGGLEDGDQVSQMAVSAMMEAFYALRIADPAEKLRRLLYEANGAVNRMLHYDRIGQCGSTLIAGLLQEGRFYFLSVGDSRICLYRDGVLSQLNREHNYLRELELRAINGEGTLEEARTHPRAAGLTSYLGMGQLKYIDQPDQPVAARPGDRFLLMSDGVYNALTAEELQQALALEDVQAAADAIGKAVEDKHWPGQDNYTAVLLQC